MGGVVIIRVEPSVWILICTALLALLLAFGKRRNEVAVLADGRGRHRRVLEQYTVGFLDAMIIATASMTVTSYAIYTAFGTAADHYLAGTLPFVLYGVFRYVWLLLCNEEGGSPTAIVWSDRAMQVTIALWAVASAVLIGLT